MNTQPAARQETGPGAGAGASRHRRRQVSIGTPGASYATVAARRSVSRRQLLIARLDMSVSPET